MDYRIEELLTRIEPNANRMPNIEETAGGLNVSVSHLEHLFKREVGISLAKYIKDLRFEKARELLETTYLNLEEILVKVGASDKSHFLRDFKKKFDSTPSEYRKNYHK